MTNLKKGDQTAKKIIKAIKEANGYLTKAADIAGVSFKTVYRYVEDYPSVKEAAEEENERTNDFTEGKLYENISKGHEASIFFRLKTKAKNRGYIERQEHTGLEGKPIQVQIYLPENYRDKPKATS